MKISQIRGKYFFQSNLDIRYSTACKWQCTVLGVKLPSTVVEEKLYANEIISALSQTETNALQDIFNQIGLRTWVSNNKFSRLTFSQSIPFGKEFVNGWFDYQTREAQIATQRNEKELNQELNWGQVHALSHTGRTLFEATQFTLLHELGHHIHAALRENNLSIFQQTMMTIRSNAVSNYAKTPQRPVEYFAETFTAWVLYRVELSVNDQLGYGMMQRALDVLGLEVNEYDFNPKTID
jgi:hypothetical protein